MTAARTQTPPIRTDPPATARQVRGRAVRLAPSILPGVMMLVIGLIGADRAVLSWDEVATADVARRSAAQIWHLSHTVDGVFAPYYLAMHLWTSVVGCSTRQPAWWPACRLTCPDDILGRYNAAGQRPHDPPATVPGPHHSTSLDA